MSPARASFLKAHRSIEDSSQDPIIEDLTLSERKHNNRAQVFRNGLAVVAFACLEYFIKSRTGELLQLIGSSGLAFVDLPEKMQKSATIDALAAMKFQADLHRHAGGDPIDYIKTIGAPISSYNNTPYSLIPLTLGHAKSNLNADDIKELLKIFDIKDGWTQMTQLSSRIGSSVLGLDTTFRQAASRRHSAAHNPNASCPTVDLKLFIDQSRILAAVFDMLVSHATNEILNNSTWTGAITHENVKIRFLDNIGPDWNETIEGNTTVLESRKKIRDIESKSVSRALLGGESLVIRGSGLRLRRWTTPC